ncbi:MAG TPA: hypothetical protein VLM75_14295 [Spirochaetota bacterium]|nr:hypothetical protein [Spirochaetota bacterium]
MVPTIAIAFAIVALFMGAMVPLFSRKNGRRGGCAAGAGGMNRCARCGSVHRSDRTPEK